MVILSAVNGVSAPEDNTLLSLQLRRLQAAFDRVIEEKHRPAPVAAAATTTVAPEVTPMQQ